MSLMESYGALSLCACHRALSPQVCAVYVAEQEVLTRTDSTAAAWAGPTARVTFRVKRQLPFGQLLKLVGGHHALGEWEVADAPGEAARPRFAGRGDHCGARSALAGQTDRRS